MKTLNKEERGMEEIMVEGSYNQDVLWDVNQDVIAAQEFSSSAK